MIDKGKILAVNTPAGLVAGLDENLFNASATDMFGLLNRLREMPQVADCYTFGATLHIVAREDFNPDEAVKSLSAAGLKDVKIYPAKGDIEDLFIKFTRNDNAD